MRDEGKNFFNIKAHSKVCQNFIFCVKVDDLLTEKAWGGGRGEAPEVNNVVYTKRQKHFNANSTHETTNWLSLTKIKVKGLDIYALPGKP